MSNRRISSKKNSSWLTWTVIFAVAIIAIAAASLLVVRYSITHGVATAKDSFRAAYEEARKDTYNTFHDIAFEIAEQEHHVSNDVLISVRAVKERPSLEALRVSDVVYIIDDSSDNNSGTTAWLKVNGEGVLTVNLTAAEFVVDNQRQHVLVRVPRPVLDSDNIKIESFETLYFEEKVWRRDNSIKSGGELAQNQLSEAQQRIQEDFEANEQYFKFAESSAVSMISSLIKGINPKVENLTVEVEFY